MSNQSQLSTFSFESNSIRTLAINNEPWFIAKDLCNTLKISNVSDALLKLDDDEKATIGLCTIGYPGHYRIRARGRNGKACSK
ncbi:Bro-N domain-containing protein [Aggregatibacter actinomycetemcomitans]|uniref:BRO-N domain-containing protein n=1 Tax=Aggregatibacter actinomycetemcomitans TaxID=714 RepID=UPI0009C0E4D4